MRPFPCNVANTLCLGVGFPFGSLSGNPPARSKYNGIASNASRSSSVIPRSVVPGAGIEPARPPRGTGF